MPYSTDLATRAERPSLLSCACERDGETSATARVLGMGRSEQARSRKFQALLRSAPEGGASWGLSLGASPTAAGVR